MEFEISGPQGFSKLDVSFNEGERLFAQPRAMMTMTTGFEIGSQLGGVSSGSPILGGVKSMLSGENFAIATYKAKRNGERLSLAPANLGEIRIIDVCEGSSYFLARGAYLAHESSIIIQPRFAGLKGWMSKKGLFLLHVSGTGKVCISSHGAIVERELADGELLVVDNDYVVAFSDTLQYELRTATASVKDSVLSGEGLVNRYQGPGRLLYQTRSRQRSGFLSSLLAVAS